MCPLEERGSDGGFAGLQEQGLELQGAGLPTNAEATDLRGRMHRAQRMMSVEEVQTFLRAQKVAHVVRPSNRRWLPDEEERNATKN